MLHLVWGLFFFFPYGWPIVSETICGSHYIFLKIKTKRSLNITITGDKTVVKYFKIPIYNTKYENIFVLKENPKKRSLVDMELQLFRSLSSVWAT